MIADQQPHTTKSNADSHSIAFGPFSVHIIIKVVMASKVEGVRRRLRNSKSGVRFQSAGQESVPHRIELLLSCLVPPRPSAPSQAQARSELTRTFAISAISAINRHQRSGTGALPCVCNSGPDPPPYYSTPRRRLLRTPLLREYAGRNQLQ
eukprot:2532428-Rhodomonas_salina.1